MRVELIKLIDLLRAEFTWTVNGWLCTPLFRYDRPNRSLCFPSSVPALGEEEHKTKTTFRSGADHAGINKFSEDYTYRVSVPLLFIGRHHWSSGLLSSRRCYSCKVDSNDNKWDAVESMKMPYHSEQGACPVIKDNDQRELFKEEIKLRTRELRPLLVKEISKSRWPMLKYGKEVRFLAALKQKYLCYLSSVHGLRSKHVEQEVCNLVSNLDLRVFAIDTVYRSRGNLTPGVDGQTLNKENLLCYLDKLSSKELDKYKSDEILRVYIPKSNGDKRPLGIPTIKDRIVQTLFLQVMEPIIDPHADPNSFGFRKGRNGHQAVGTLSQLLNGKPHSKRLRNKVTHRYFRHSKMVINLDIKSFFDEVCQDYLLENYPIPRKYKHVLTAWLKAPTYYQNEISSVLSGFPQGSVIGPSLANFTLNGLEDVAKPRQSTKVDLEKKDYLKSKGEIYNDGNSIIRKSIKTSVVRYCDDFIIVTNDESEVPLIMERIINFLSERGLCINESKSKCSKWTDGVKFNFLGFTFHNITNYKPSIITEQRDSLSRRKLRGGLYVYPSTASVNAFKAKIKFVLRSNTNFSVYRMIQTLNPIIRGWGLYFGVGTLRVASRLDHYIWYRTWRFLRRKFKKTPTRFLTERYYQGVEGPNGRSWHFHGTWLDAPSNHVSRHGKIVWLQLLCKLFTPVPSQTFNVSKALRETSYYIDSSHSEKWSIKVMRLRGRDKTSNSWNDLYVKQKGMCTICGQYLGHLLEENLEIHHVNKVSEGGSNSIDNLELIHKSCHKTRHVSK